MQLQHDEMGKHMRPCLSCDGSGYLFTKIPFDFSGSGNSEDGTIPVAYHCKDCNSDGHYALNKGSVHASPYVQDSI